MYRIYCAWKESRKAVEDTKRLFDQPEGQTKVDAGVCTTKGLSARGSSSLFFLMFSFSYDSISKNNFCLQTNLSKNNNKSKLREKAPTVASEDAHTVPPVAGGERGVGLRLQFFKMLVCGPLLLLDHQHVHAAAVPYVQGPAGI